MMTVMMAATAVESHVLQRTAMSIATEKLLLLRQAAPLD
jgi:hypothetical protein